MMNLYRLYMLKFVTLNITAIDKKFSTSKRRKIRIQTSHPCLSPKDESDYSDGDFQDLMSN